VLQWMPDGTRTLRDAGRAFCRASGVAASVAFWPGLGIFQGRGWLTMGYHAGTTQEGVTGFDFGS